MAEKLAVMQSPISKEDQVMTLLGSVPSSCDLLVAALGARVDKMEYSMVERSILDEETCRIGSGRVDPPGVVTMYGKTVGPAEGKKSRSGWGSAETKGKCYLCE